MKRMGGSLGTSYIVTPAKAGVQADSPPAASQRNRIYGWTFTACWCSVMLRPREYDHAEH